MTLNKLTDLQRNFLFICLGIATFMVSIDYAIANISIPYIAGDLAVGTEEGTYVITWFAVGNAVGLAMTGWLSKRIGGVRLLLYSIALFTIVSWLCGFSFNLNMLVICRFLQGLVGGPIVPLAQSLIVEYGSPETRRKDLAIWGGIVITAPVLGPIAGGYISYWYSWPWIFYINIPVGIFCVIAIWLLMKRQEAKTEKAPGDMVGILLLLFYLSDHLGDLEEDPSPQPAAFFHIFIYRVDSLPDDFLCDLLRYHCPDPPLAAAIYGLRCCLGWAHRLCSWHWPPHLFDFYPSGHQKYRQYPDSPYWVFHFFDCLLL